MEFENALHEFDDDMREFMLRLPVAGIDGSHLSTMNEISLLLSDIAFPVATALACLQLRTWQHWRNANCKRSEWENRRKDIIMLANALNIASAPVGLSQEPWLVVDMVDNRISICPTMDRIDGDDGRNPGGRLRSTTRKPTSCKTIV
jgi:hypothetical protein